MQSTGNDAVPNLKPMTVRLPTELARGAKLRAVEEDRPLQALVADALEAYLRREAPGRIG